MPRINDDIISAYKKRKDEQEEKKKLGGEASTSQPINIDPRISNPPITSNTAEVEDQIPISLVHPEGQHPRKRARSGPETSSADPTGTRDPKAIFLGIESFDVTDPSTAYIAGNTATVLIWSLLGFATTVGGKAVEEKKAARDAAAAQNNNEEELGKDNTEVVRLKECINELEESLRAMEGQEIKLEMKAAEEANKVEKRIKDLDQELEEMTGECLGCLRKDITNALAKSNF